MYLSEVPGYLVLTVAVEKLPHVHVSVVKQVLESAPYIIVMCTLKNHVVFILNYVRAAMSAPTLLTFNSFIIRGTFPFASKGSDMPTTQTELHHAPVHAIRDTNGTNMRMINAVAFWFETKIPEVGATGGTLRRALYNGYPFCVKGKQRLGIYIYINTNPFVKFYF